MARALATVALLLAAGALSKDARAAEDSASGDAQEEPPATTQAPASKRSGLLPSVGLHMTLALSSLSEDDVDQARLLLGGMDVELGLGGRVGRSSRIAYELAVGVRSVLDVTQRLVQPGYDVPAEEDLHGGLTFVLPLGACFDLLPDSPSGLFGSVHAGVGWFAPPPFIPESELHFAGRVALDAGWQLPLGEHSALGLSVRYSALGLKRLYLDEAYNNVLVSHELSLGALWHFL